MTHLLQDNERVRVAGLLDTICFDKTGTLTDIGLEFGGALPANEGRQVDGARAYKLMEALSASILDACWKHACRLDCCMMSTRSAHLEACLRDVDV